MKKIYKKRGIRNESSKKNKERINTWVEGRTWNEINTERKKAEKQEKNSKQEKKKKWREQQTIIQVNI